MNCFKFSNLKIKYSLLLILVVTALLISCQDKKPHQEEVEPTKEMLAHIIKTEKAVEIYKNYEEQRLSILKDTLRAIYKDENFDDTRRVWFDLKSLKNYIDYVETKSAKNNINPEGLQFYFSVYGDDADNQKNHQTIFIAPTTKNEGVQSGYTLHVVDGETQPLYLKTILKNGRYDDQSQNQQMDKAGFFSLTAIQDEDGLLYNRGTGGPPHGNN